MEFTSGIEISTRNVKVYVIALAQSFGMTSLLVTMMGGVHERCDTIEDFLNFARFLDNQFFINSL